MRKAEYAYPKMQKASSYQKVLIDKVEELKLLGARIEIKEYTGRPPGWSSDNGGYTGKELKDANIMLIVIKNPGRTGRVLASTYVCKEFYYGTIKVAERADADVMQACVDQLLEHVTAAVQEKSA
jgi:hypothetical protein